MPRSKTDTFDHMVHNANTWLADVAEAFGTEDRRFAYRVLRAWLHTVRDRLTVEGAAHFASQLPELVRGVFYDGWNPSRVPVKYGPDEFIDRFATEANIPAGDVRRTAARVSQVMQARFSPGQLDHVLAQLPEWLRDIVAGEAVVEQPVGERRNPATTEARVRRVEEQVSALAEALRTLVHGLEDRPDIEPDKQRPAKAARQAHEMLLAAGL
ncbi:MAG: DUF2267 domain-containing protein [Actinomycetota bacterium]